MKTLAIVPVKPFKEGKSRLNGVLTNDERYLLNLHSLKRTIRILSNLEDIDEIIVISRDPEVLAYGRNEGAVTIMENNQGLNRALYQVNNTLDKSCDRVLVIPTDLPLLSMEDVQKVLKFGASTTGGCDRPRSTTERHQCLIGQTRRLHSLSFRFIFGKKTC